MKTLLLGLLLTASVGFNAWLLRDHQSRRLRLERTRSDLHQVRQRTGDRVAGTRRLADAASEIGLSASERTELLRLRAEIASTAGNRDRHAALEAELGRLRTDLLRRPAARNLPPVPATVGSDTAAQAELLAARQQLEASISHDEELLAQWNQLAAEGRVEWLVNVQPTTGLSTLVAEIQEAAALHQQLAQSADTDPAEIERLSQLVSSLQVQAEQEAAQVIAEVTSRLAGSRDSLRRLETEAVATAGNTP